MCKRWMCLLLTLLLLMGTAACTGGGSDDSTGSSATASTPPGTTQGAQVYDISVWVPVGYVELTQKQIAQFNADHVGQYRFDATVIAEPEPVTKIRINGVSAPDLFCFTSDDYTQTMVSYGLLSALSQEDADYVQKNHHANAVASASVGDQLYAYPMSTQPSNILYYDKSVLSAEDVQSVEALISACQASGRKFLWLLDVAEAAAFFEAVGCVSNWTADAQGQWISVQDTYNSPAGIAALEKMLSIEQSPWHSMVGDLEVFGQEPPFAAMVAWPWYLQDGSAAEILGDNLGIAPLPSFQCDGNTYWPKPYSYDRLLGITPQQDGDRLEALQALARYLTDEACQMQRYTQLQLLPSHLQAQQAVIREEPYWEAVWAQTCSVRQFRSAAWWQHMNDMLIRVRQGMPPEDALRKYQWAVEDECKDHTWSVIGGFPGMEWTGFFAMVAQSDGTYRTEEALYFTANSEFKILYERRWDINYGADGQLNGENIKPGVTGYYYVVFDPATGLCRLEPQ